ncbi:MAG: Bro-N domain-containing protein, partial [Bacteroidaceae bacterium]|nr:Bro-N domain-containing protein [Bacteroidaceae bacterium]
MKNQIFKSKEFGQIRTCMVGGETYFVGKDVAEALGYLNTRKAIHDHVDDEDKLEERIVTSGQARGIIVINESGLYSLILSSKLESAKRFKRWVTSEVLPAIRKNGRYDLEQKIVETEMQCCKLEATLISQKPLTDYARTILN